MSSPAASSCAPVTPLPAGTWRRPPPGGDVRRSERAGSAVHYDGLVGRGESRATEADRRGVREVVRVHVGDVGDLGGVTPRAERDGGQRLALRQDLAGLGLQLVHTTVSSDIMLPFFFLLDFRYPRLAGTGGFARADLGVRRARAESGGKSRMTRWSM